jgi:glutathione synthase/RimK-type ligase-like ATP-grasp enzyme
MSLYGLDIITNNENNKRLLNEINGIRSGMRGFQKIYGDDRVKRRVLSMLEKEYGKITINDGTFKLNQFKKKHPLRYLLRCILFQIPSIKRTYCNHNPTLLSEKAETDWISEKIKNSKMMELPFEIYNGQESYVMNLLNEVLPHPTINSFVAEEIACNKFLQYLLLKDSEIKDVIIKSSIVGLGATDEKELEQMVTEYDQFVIKPVMGYCGLGIRFLDKNEVMEKYENSRGPIEDVEDFSKIISMTQKKQVQAEYIEDLITNDDFSFEPGISIIQPFIDSRRNDENYSVVRVIVCNGKFIDAYQKVSANPKVNLSHDATPIEFDYDQEFIDYCENIVNVFEEEANKYSVEDCKRLLYQKYINSRGKTTLQERESDGTLSWTGMFGI